MPFSAGKDGMIEKAFRECGKFLFGSCADGIGILSLFLPSLGLCLHPDFLVDEGGYLYIGVYTHAESYAHSRITDRRAGIHH